MRLLKPLDPLLRLLVLLAALHVGLLGAFRLHLLRALVRLAPAGPAERTLYALVGLAALALVFKRAFYLPFLGKAVYPCGALQEKRPTGANTAVPLQTDRARTSVIYWAAEPNNAATEDAILDSPWLAYGAYANAGVVTTDDAGRAVLHLRGPPARYRVPGKGALQAHVHYRLCKKPGMLGPVQTLRVAAASA
jgi:uncharacterized membrane protein YuzA (DUF378 family)